MQQENKSQGKERITYCNNVEHDNLISAYAKDKLHRSGIRYHSTFIPIHTQVLVFNLLFNKENETKVLDPVYYILNKSPHIFSICNHEFMEILC